MRFDGKSVIPDQIAERINWLTKHYLVKVTTDESGWNTLYKDPEDGRYWELTFPDSELQGGGPPSLTTVSLDRLKLIYAISIP